MCGSDLGPSGCHAGASFLASARRVDVQSKHAEPVLYWAPAQHQHCGGNELHEFANVRGAKDRHNSRITAWTGTSQTSDNQIGQCWS